jgi:hypothetical protein
MDKETLVKNTNIKLGELVKLRREAIEKIKERQKQLGESLNEEINTRDAEQAYYYGLLIGAERGIEALQKLIRENNLYIK